MTLFSVSNKVKQDQAQLKFIMAIMMSLSRLKIFQHQEQIIINRNTGMYEEKEKEEKIDVRVSQLAYKKIIYHLVRYPTSKVTGALVGKGNQVQDAYPLFHTPILNPTISVALDLIESNLPESQKIIGFYEFVEGSEPKINSIVENNLQMKDMITVRVWLNVQKQIKFGSARYNFIIPSWETASQGLRNGDYRFLVDFDAHFEEIQLDFRNTYIH